MIIDCVALGFSARENQAVRHRLPLMAHLFITTVHTVVVVDVTTTNSRIRNLASPSMSIGSGHLVGCIKEVEFAVVDMQHYFLAKDGLII